MHPYVIGRGYRMLGFEDLLEKLLAAGAVFMTMEDAAREAALKMGERGEAAGKSASPIASRSERAHQR
jgi:hypothetical protein